MGVITNAGEWKHFVMYSKKMLNTKVSVEFYFHFLQTEKLTGKLKKHELKMNVQRQ